MEMRRRGREERGEAGGTTNVVIDELDALPHQSHRVVCLPTVPPIPIPGSHGDLWYSSCPRRVPAREIHAMEGRAQLRGTFRLRASVSGGAT